MHQNAPFFRIVSMDRINLPEGLRTKVFTLIQKEELRRARILAFSALVLLFSSMIGGVFAIKYLVQSISQSGFYSYLLLLFSDPDVILTSWKELMLLLAESAPLAAITFFLLALVPLLASVRTLVKNLKPQLLPALIN